MKFILSILLLLSTNPLVASELVPDRSHSTVTTDSIETINRFMTTLSGTWDGLAVETPVGQVDYPITFHKCDDAAIAGVAELRVSNHHWKFWFSNKELRLTFMSTFQGNRQPTQLVLSKVENGILHFHAPDLALLTLSISMDLPNIGIRIFHHLKPHVYIRLIPSNIALSETESAANQRLGCSAFPAIKKPAG